MPLKEIARQTLNIIGQGFYTSQSGNRVCLQSQIDESIKGTVLYCQDDLLKLSGKQSVPEAHAPAGAPLFPVIEVTGETTAQAAARLIVRENCPNVAALNFASARNPGGGFINGARAQEEDLCRCSALYACLIAQGAYYEANRRCSSCLYTDHIIYSPQVPFFRNEEFQLLERPILVSIITAPAPNAGVVLKHDPPAARQIHETLERRAAFVLSVAAAQAQKTLVLGAWGCGAFRNQPAEVADIFARHLQSPDFVSSFERIVFAIYDRSSSGKTRQAFSERLAGVYTV
jgi:uncharacterized protein (TIGR02452 family)